MTSREIPPFDFWRILKGVSRSFYLTLWLLPSSTRRTVGLAYGLARAADTIADTYRLQPARRKEKLKLFRKVLAQRLEGEENTVEERELKEYFALMGESLMKPGKIDYEGVLLLEISKFIEIYSHLPSWDQKRVYEVIDVIVEGMEFDLSRFSSESSNQIQSLENRGELDRYCYQVAGVVGEFWTEIHLRHLPELKGERKKFFTEMGIRFGKALQMTNILRDIPSDLKKGRCYLPRRDLERLNLAPRDLLNPATGTVILPLYRELLELTLDHYQGGLCYFFALPTSCYRMRLACALPLLIGLKTIGLLCQCSNPLQTPLKKIRRREVYSLLFQSFFLLPFEKLTKNLFRRLCQQARIPWERVSPQRR